jgi:hypothetical protein
MSNEIEVTCRIPAPPDGWVYDGWRYPAIGDIACHDEDGWSTEYGEADADFEHLPIHCAVRAPAEPVYEANELVRFFEYMDYDGVKGIDDTGGYWHTSNIWLPMTNYMESAFTELHPRLTVRRDVIGDTSTDLLAFPIVAGMQVRGQCYPCDQQGNPLGQERNQSQTSGGDSILPEGWTRDGKWILAPIEWVDFPQIRGRHRQDYPAELGDLVDDKDYRCVGFVDPEDEVDAFYNGEDLTFAQCMKPYSILGDWRATHAVLLEAE